jgi:hypothetical protein
VGVERRGGHGRERQEAAGSLLSEEREEKRREAEKPQQGIRPRLGRIQREEERARGEGDEGRT